MTRIIIQIAFFIALTITKSFCQTNDSIKNIDKNKDIAKEFTTKLEVANAKIIEIKEATKKRIEERIALLKDPKNAADIENIKQEEIEKSSNEISIIKKELIKSVDKNLTEKINNDEILIDSTKFEINVKIKKEKNKHKSPKRTETQAVFAGGINNVIQNGQYGDKDFRLWGSHFYEVGFTWNTRILKDNNLLHFKYGFSAVWNNLRPKDNRIFEVVNGKTELISAGRGLTDSRFTNSQLIFPMHLEFDFSKNGIDKEGNTYFRTHKGFRAGFGGYLGFTTQLAANQHSEFEENNHDVEIISKKNYGTNNFIYGLSAYVGFSETSLYVKYDLNPLFKNSTNKLNNISLGVRFDLN